VVSDAPNETTTTVGPSSSSTLEKRGVRVRAILENGRERPPLDFFAVAR